MHLPMRIEAASLSAVFEHIGAPISVLMALACVVISLYAFFVRDHLYAALSLHPHTLSRQRAWHTLLSQHLIHGDFIHLAFNALALLMVGAQLELIVGSMVFGSFTLGLALMISGLLWRQYRKVPTYYSLGCSGLALAYLIAFLILQPMQTAIEPHPLARALSVGYALVYLAYLLWAVYYREDNISTEGHVAGMLGGIALAALALPAVNPAAADWLGL